MSDIFSGHFLILFTSETNRIENIDFSYNDTRELFETGRLSSYTGDLRAALSVVNNQAVAKYLNGQLEVKAPVTQELIREVHRLLMFASVDNHRYHDNGERAGEYKVHDYCVGKYSVGSQPLDVAQDVKDLCDVVSSTKSTDPLKIATAFMCHFENIHPFADGNGRVGRWVSNYILALHGVAPVVFYSEDRREYYEALEHFDFTGEYDKMLAYFRRQSDKGTGAVREIHLE